MTELFNASAARKPATPTKMARRPSTSSARLALGRSLLACVAAGCAAPGFGGLGDAELPAAGMTTFWFVDAEVDDRCAGRAAADPIGRSTTSSRALEATPVASAPARFTASYPRCQEVCGRVGF